MTFELVELTANGWRSLTIGIFEDPQDGMRWLWDEAEAGEHEHAGELWGRIDGEVMVPL